MNSVYGMSNRDSLLGVKGRRRERRKDCEEKEVLVFYLDSVKDETNPAKKRTRREKESRMRKRETRRRTRVHTA